MAEKRENTGVVTEHYNNVDDGLQKSGEVKEANVASVALGKIFLPP